MIHLKLETEILGLRVSFEEGGKLEFSYKSPTPIVVTFRPHEQHNGDRPTSPARAICTAIAGPDIEPDFKF